MNEFGHLAADPQLFIPLMDGLDTGFTAVDSEGKFLVWNQALTNILGKGVALDIPPQDWPAFYGLHCPIRQELLPYEELPLAVALLEGEHVERELLIINDSHSEGRWIKVMARPLFDSTRKLAGAAALVRDVTDEKASFLSAQMMSWFFQASDDGIVGVNLEGRVLLWNPGAERLFGWTSEEMVGQPIHKMLPPGQRDEVERMLEKARKNYDLPPREVSIPHRQGQLFDISRSVTVMRDGAGQPMGGVVVCRDITSLKETERQLEESERHLRLLSNRQQNLLEQQLAALARELHDELGQQLAAMKYELAWFERHLEDSKFESHLDSLNQLLTTTIAGLRRVSKQMRPPLLEELGLCHALHELVTNLGQRFSVQADYECGARHLHFEPDAALAIYRIVQEALTNVVKHAQADQVLVTLDQEDGRVVARVRDNGKGLPTTPGTQGLNFGILGMQERARSWDGELKVFDVPKGGVMVSASFPLERMTR